MCSPTINAIFFSVGIVTFLLFTHQVDSIKVSLNRVNNSPDVFGFYQNCTANICESKNAFIQKSRIGACYCQCQQDLPNFVAQADFYGSSCTDGGDVNAKYGKIR